MRYEEARPDPPPPPPPVAVQSLPVAARELLAGFAAGAANVASGYPFDTVKVRLQSAAPGQYGGAVHCLRSIVRHEGVRRGLFRGLSSPLVGGTAETGVNYLVYSRVLEALRPAGGAGSGGGGGGSRGDSAAAAAPLASVAVAGAVAGAALSFILGPTELVKCRMQQAGSAALYPGGPLHCLRDIVVREGGARGLARGLGATVAREVPGNALFFAMYEGLRRGLLGALDETESLGARQTTIAPAGGPPGAVAPELWSPPSSPFASSSPPAQWASPAFTDMTAQADASPGGARGAEVPAFPRPQTPPPQQQQQQQQQPQQKPYYEGHTGRHWLMEAAIAIFCGGTAGTVMWAVVLPIDVAKTRLQTARPGSEWDVGLRRHWAMLWREGGFASLYAGLTPTLVRAFPANACQWLAWELVMRNLGDGNH